MLHRYSDTHDIQEKQDIQEIQRYSRKYMVTRANRNFTPQEIERWKEHLFSERNLRVPVTELDKWPLSQYLWAAVFQARDLHELREPLDQNWQTPAWDFGRFAKAHPSLINLDENQALDAVRRAIGSGFWDEFLDMDQADAEMAFDDIWIQCRAIPGYDPLTVAVLEARNSKDDAADGPEGYETFLNVARSLKRQLGDKPFMLPCHKLAPMLACQPMTISRYRQKAIRDGHLKIAKQHSFRSATKGEATEFTYND
ncbi:MAG TPA: hypothetical protein VG714_10185 [Acidobacteriaceae bacterium]|nr:hypothetical protein [Acidobacteriaceae bacterium]